MTKKSKQAGKIGNRNAAKPEGQRRTSRLVINMTPREKATCVKQADGKLIPWARRKLGLDC